MWPQPGEELHQQDCGEAGSPFCFAFCSVFSPFITFFHPPNLFLLFSSSSLLDLNPPVVPTKASGFRLWHLKLPALIQADSLRQGSPAPHQDCSPISALHCPHSFSLPSPQSPQQSGWGWIWAVPADAHGAEDSPWLDHWSRALWLPHARAVSPLWVHMAHPSVQLCLGPQLSPAKLCSHHQPLLKSQTMLKVK